LRQGRVAHRSAQRECGQNARNLKSNGSHLSPPGTDRRRIEQD
jgi:hypothetical protein